MYLGDTHVSRDTPVTWLVLGILAGLALTVLLMGRIVGEEAMLTREPEGYRDVFGPFITAFLPG